MSVLSKWFDGFKSNRTVTKNDLKQLEEKIMSRIAELEALNSKVAAEILDNIGAVLEEVKVTHEAVKALDKMISDLQNSPGEWTPEDQAAFDRIQAKSNEILGRTKALRENTQTLREDAATPPTTPVTPPATPPIDPVPPVTTIPVPSNKLHSNPDPEGEADAVTRSRAANRFGKHK